MKKIHTSIILIIVTFTTLFAQVPESFNYQTVVRNSSGEIIPNTNVAFRISILQGSATGTPVYVETHYVNTNNFGLVNLKVGMGNVEEGIFMRGDWGTETHYLKVEFDKDGGAGFVHLGTSPLLSVPYAFHAQTVTEDNVDDADADPNNEIQEIQISGTQLTLSKGGGTVTLPSSGGGGDNWGTQTVTSDATLSGRGTEADPLKVESSSLEPEWTNIANKPAGFADGEDDINDNDADPDNEIQTLAITGNDLSISDGNTVSLPESAASVWSKQGTNAYFTGGKVGIGIDTPEEDLVVHTGAAPISSIAVQTNASGSSTHDGFQMFINNANEASLINYENEKLYLGTNQRINMTLSPGDKVGINEQEPSTTLHIKGDGFLFEGEGDGGSIPATGSGTRMMWYPKKSAFRAGYSNGNLWDDAKTGSYSVAMGLGTEASGDFGSTAFGEDTKASGISSFASGVATQATGDYSTAMGHSNTATGNFSTAIGSETAASGDNSFSAGEQTKAESFSSAAFGRYNVGGGSATSWDGYDPLFEIGNGTSSDRSNAFTVFKNGNVGIGESYPLYDLDVSGMLCVRDGAGLIFAPQSNKVTLGFFTSTNDMTLAEFKYGEIKLQTNLHVIDGDVGIGTENPERILHIKGDNPRVLIEAASSNPEVNFKNEGDLNTDIWAIYKNGATGNLNFYQNGNKLTLQKNTGNVGIGTTNPQGKLDVNGSIYQRGGQLHADYVFNENYQLESIEEHAEFMWKNKHLPAIPKAKTDENGFEVIEVGSHRRGIVEELEKAHIYISQLEQKLKTLEERIDQLEFEKK